MNTLPALCTYAALATLALSMARHHRTITARELPRGRKYLLRATGFLLLSVGLACDLILQGTELGPVSWFATLAAAGIALTLLLTFQPRWWAAPLVLLALTSAL